MNQLSTLIKEHPEVFTIKAHAASAALHAGNIERALELLHEARGMRRLELGYPVELYLAARLHING